MKILLFIPDIYSLKGSIINGFTELGHEVISIDYRHYHPGWFLRAKRRSSKLNNTIRDRLDFHYYNDVNKKHLEIYNREMSVDIVVIYNHELFSPETIKIMKRESKIIFYLGDNPYYSPGNDYNLAVLLQADLIASPDTFWNKQISLLGAKNIIFSILGYNENSNYIYSPTIEETNQYSSDIVYVGTNYKSSWGYKRTLFLSQFAHLDTKIFTHGPSWSKWLKHFPELEDNIVIRRNRMSDRELNTILNCCKIYPVDANPGLLNGLHIRIFDCIASGILPIVEYRDDLDIVFKGVEIPSIRNYLLAESIAKKYLNDDSLRESTSSILQEFVKSNYSPKITIRNIISHL